MSASFETMDPILQNQLNRVVNAVVKAVDNRSLRSISKTSEEGTSASEPDPRRSIGDECGWPATGTLTVDHYKEMYFRNSIARKVVDFPATQCWQVTPTVFDGESPDEDTPFKQAVEDLAASLRGGSLFNGSLGNPLWRCVARADARSRIGHYGVIVLGVGGTEGSDLSQPLEFKRGPKATRKLIYMKALPEYMAQITSYDEDPNSSRYKLPSMYQVEFNEEEELRLNPDSIATTKSTVASVHWSRVVHIADSDSALMEPVQRPVFNHLMDLRKVYGSSAEGYWTGSILGLALSTHPQLGGDVVIDDDALRTELEKFFSGLQRTLRLIGMEANTLSPEVVDPTPQINVLIDAVCAYIDCPKRIFMGSERGDLASTQDKSHWEDVKQARREKYCTPVLVVPLFDRLIDLGMLPEPKQYGVQWPEIETLDAGEKAEVALKITQAIVAYVAGGLYNFIKPVPYLVEIVGLDEQTAKNILVQLAEDEETLVMPEIKPTDPQGKKR